MVRRLHLEAGRLILSQPGHAASPSLPDANKIIDSEWGYAGLLIAAGEAADPSYPRGGGADQHSSITTDSQDWEIPFPDVGYKPTVILMTYREAEGYIWAFSNCTLYGANVTSATPRLYNIQVETNRILFGRIYAGEGYYRMHNSKLIYMVFGFA